MSLGLINVALGQQGAAERAVRQPGAPLDAAAQPGTHPGAAELQSGAGPSPPEQKYINTQPELNRKRDQMHRGRPQSAVIADPQTSGAYGGQRNSQNQMNGQASATAGGQQRGELGVYMVAGDRPGVEVSRITPGSAAEQAGLRDGDIILQVNGRNASTPQETAQMIRQIPVGQSVTLTVSRDGNQQQVQATMRQARQRREMTGDLMDRDPYRVGFRGEDDSRSSGGGESPSRVRQLEEQVASLQRELHAMEQEVTQLRSGVVGTGAAGAGATGGAQGLAPPAGGGSDLSTPAGAGTGAAAPPPGFGGTGSITTTTTGTSGTSTSGAASTPAAGAAGSTSGAAGSTSGAAGSTPAAGGSASGAGSTSGNTSSGAAGSTSGSPSGGAAGSTSGAGGAGAGTSGAGGGSTSGAAGGSSTSGSSSKTGNDTKSSTDDLFGK